MKVRNLVSKRFKETPADCQIASQALMMRGGYIKPVGNGIFTLCRHHQAHHLEDREDHARGNGSHRRPGGALPRDHARRAVARVRSLSIPWAASCCASRDRSGADMVLGMTHEEAAVHLARDLADSYAQYPFMIYQIQTKFRDEPRCRGGLIRVREFTMKDAYSFHTSQEDLETILRRVPTRPTTASSPAAACPKWSPWPPTPA